MADQGREIVLQGHIEQEIQSFYIKARTISNTFLYLKIRIITNLMSGHVCVLL